MKIYNFILQGHEATEENAIDAARGLDWQDIETSDGGGRDSNYVDTINGVEIYYNFAADYYFFAEDETPDTREFSSLKSKKRYKLIALKRNDDFFNIYCQSFGALSGVYCGEALINSRIFGAPDLSHAAAALRVENINFEI